MKKFFKQFTVFEVALFFASLTTIVVAFFACGNTNYLYLAASVVGLGLLTFAAKGHFMGQVLTIAFAIIYAVISFKYAYYGEMITYLGMSAPIAVAALISWIRNPAEKGKSEVKVNNLSLKEYIFMAVLAAGVTVAFYFILRAFDTANLILSTVSVFTSFVASYFTLRRSRFYAAAYALNDIVLIALWSLAAADRPEYIAMVVNFAVFLANDAYGFFNWTRMQIKQKKEAVS